MDNQQESNASVIALSKDKIIAIGTESTIKEFKGASTELVDMAGAFITPGSICSHVHLMMCGKYVILGRPRHCIDSRFIRSTFPLRRHRTV